MSRQNPTRVVAAFRGRHMITLFYSDGDNVNHSMKSFSLTSWPYADLLHTSYDLSPHWGLVLRLYNTLPYCANQRHMISMYSSSLQF